MERHDITEPVFTLELYFFLEADHYKQLPGERNKHTGLSLAKKQRRLTGILVPDRGQWRPFLCRVSFPVWLVTLAEARARLFLQFPFSSFFLLASFPLMGGAGGSGDSVPALQTPPPYSSMHLLTMGAL